MQDSQEDAERLFEALLGLNPTERQAFLENGCREKPALRVKVEDLLAQDAIAGSFLQHPLFGCLPDENVMHENIANARSQSPDTPLPLNLIYRPQFHPGDILCNRFVVVRFIAKGGMGEVYEVEDRQLRGVHLALKTVLGHFALDPGMQGRFEREVLLAREVVHPNLCPIYDIFHWDRPEGRLTFLTMRLLAGETLAARLGRTGPLPLPEATLILTQVAAGLTAAHNANILHRDIKTSNIMLNDAGDQVYACITDFGLARAALNDSTALTMGMAGTPGYMAPELYFGEPPSKASDVFSFGVVSYQVFTGRMPPPSLKPNPQRASYELTKDLPAPWNELIKGCLENSPERRFQSAPEVEQALQGFYARTTIRQRYSLAMVSAAGTIAVLLGLLFIPAVSERLIGFFLSSPQKHIVVLPFGIVGNTPETQALGDGMMVSLAGRLSNLDTINKALWVVPAEEVRSRKVRDASSALHEFGATIVVEGSFEHSGQVTHLILTLIDPKKTREIGFLDLKNQTGDLAVLEDEAVTRLGRLMNISARDDAVSSREPSERTVYEDYIAALGYLQRYDKPGNLTKAINLLLIAVKAEPGFALAFAHLGEAYTLKYQLDSNPEWLQAAGDSCRKAALLDNRVPFTYVALAKLHDITGQHELAIQEFQHAIDLDPRDATAFAGMAASYRDAGLYTDAEAAYKKAAELRPDDWNGFNYLGNFYERIGRHQDAIAQFRHAIELTPDNAYVYSNLGGAYLNAGDPKLLPEAERMFKKSLSLNPSYQTFANLGNLYGIEQRFGESAEFSLKALQINDQSYDIWNNLSQAYEALDEDEKARAAREKVSEIAERAVKLNSQDADAQSTLATVYAKDKLKEKAMAKIRISLTLAPKSQSVLSGVAEAYEILGDRKAAIRYLDLAVENGFPVEQLRGDPTLERIASDPNFSRLGMGSR